MNQENHWSTIESIATRLSEANIAYQFVHETAMFIQGITECQSKEVSVQIQWDALDHAYELFTHYLPTEMTRDLAKASFSFKFNDHLVKIICHFNRTVRTDPYRILIETHNASLWCISLYGYLFFQPADSRFKQTVQSFLHQKQQEITANNNQAWNQNNYQALLNRYGNPIDVAMKIKENPEWRLHPFYKYMGDVKKKRVLHLLGSNGVKGVALSLMGADVTIVDFSHENKRFATELASAADVSLTYVHADVLNLPESVTAKQYDIVLMELGVLHYFLDLQPLLQTIDSLLMKEGQFILHEFHPISTKLISSSGKKHKVTGNYFYPAIESSNVAFSKHLDEPNQSVLTEVLQRKWTIGEVVTAMGQTELKMTTLEEEPNHKIHDIGLPKTYTIVAKKM